MTIPALLLYFVILIAALYIPWREGLIKNSVYLLVTAVALCAAFASRVYFFSYHSGDYNMFLSLWVQFFRDNGGFAGLSQSVGNYNFPYLYFLALFSYIGIDDLYLIKLLSVSFDVVMAFAMMKLTGLFTDSSPRRLAAYLITLLLPTVVLNSSMWGQCDSIYTAFAILFLWLVLSGRPKASMVCLALSFGFKLQAVFIMPVCLVLLFARKLKFTDLLIFPLTYIILILPAVIAGRPIMDAFLLYYNQAETVGESLNYNSPSIFALINRNINASSASAAGIAAAFAYLFLIYLWTWLRRRSLTNESLLFVTLLTVIGVPYLLPHMHDRYFYMADVLTLTPAVLYAGYLIIPALTSFASFICYYWYLKYEYLYPSSYGAAALLGVLILLFILTGSRLNSGPSDAKPAESPEPPPLPLKVFISPALLKNYVLTK